MKPTRIRRQIGPFLLNIFFMLLVFGGCGGETSIGVGGGSCVGATCQTGGNGGGGASPDAPILSIAAGDGENTLTLAPPAGSGATNFNVYWSTSPNITTATGTKIANVTSPFVHTGLTNGTSIFYIATVVSGNSQSSPSLVSGGMPGRWTASLNACTPSPCVPLPPARDSHTAVYNPTSDRMIVFGGRGASQILSDLWILENASSTTTAVWSNPTAANAPSARLGQTAVYRESSNQMTVFGGSFNSDGTSLTNQLFGLSNADASTSTPVWNGPLGAGGPTARWGHAAVYDTAGDKMVVFGGSTQTGQGLSNEVWVLDQAATLGPLWRQITTIGGPSARCCMAAGYDAANRRMILFGGSGFGQSGPVVFDDLWTLTFNSTFTTATWKELTPSGGTAPSARCCGVGLWDGSAFLLFGGGQFGNPSDDKIYALVLQPTTFAVAAGPGGGPVARTFPTAVPAGRFLLFGGAGGVGPLNDLWRLE